ncbi:phosphatase PAP2 family protein [Pelomonas sp. P7]|uniref:Phosphatase PAP2 family protein n=1 Tax=Pelomonas caseinilytica TaxID=2906763 RepID=A0ABS8XL52_9BURK|nr:phosphatase PAP2 family protein [Pelomonas sp. P7]MCE4540292.1 phosphatase PAP2 family protein [Pelomonas sp. P7]
MVLLETLGNIVKLIASVGGLYLVALLYAQHRQPAWVDTLRARRIHVLWLLVLTSLSIKIVEDVVTGDSGTIDRALLIFLRAHLAGAQPIFEAVTLSGSAEVLTPLTLGTCLALALSRRRQEAALVGTSVISAAVLVYVVKLVVGRQRPALWETARYWGASFPSGHTLVVAAFSMSMALALSGMKPAARTALLTIASLWTVLVAISRLVLGVHWPTDVLVAALAGTAIPLGISLLMTHALQVKAQRP